MDGASSMVDRVQANPTAPSLGARLAPECAGMNLLFSSPKLIDIGGWAGACAPLARQAGSSGWFFILMLIQAAGIAG